MSRAALLISLVALAVACWAAWPLPAPPDPALAEWRGWATRAARVLTDLDRRLTAVEREVRTRAGEPGR